MQLTPNQLRVIGCLVEKSLTTPDQYPLSLNALTNACNQKSNREPVLTLTEIEVQNTLDELLDSGLIMTQSGATSRVAKYKHRFCNTEFGELQLTAQELAILCVLFLRGPQTPGELRTRTNRLCEFTDVHETETVLDELSSNDARVVKLAREPGKRESRYAHCFGQTHDFGDAIDTSESIELEQSMIEQTGLEPTLNADSHASQNDKRILALEEQLELMQLEIDELREMIKSSNSQ